MSHVRDLLGALLCCLVLAAVPSLASADSAQGRAEFAEGRKQFAAGDFRAALGWFKTGYAQTKDPAFLLNMAQCHRNLGDTETALEMFRAFLKSPPEQTSPAARDIASKAIREIESAPGYAPPSGASAAGRGAGDAAGRPALRSGRKFQTEPNALPVLDSPSEAQVVSVKATTTAEPVDPAKTATMVRRLRIAALACGGVGLISSGIGVYYWTRARSLSDSANKATVFDRADYDEGKRAEKMQWIFYGVGGSVVVAGLGLWIYSTLLPPPEKSGVSLAPMVGPAMAGLSAGGAF